MFRVQKELDRYFKELQNVFYTTNNEYKGKNFIDVLLWVHYVEMLKAAQCVLPQGQTDGYLLYLSLLHKNVDMSQKQDIIIHFEDYTNISVYPACVLLLTVFIISVGWITVRKKDLK